MTNWEWLQKWVAEHCDGTWRHEQPFVIKKIEIGVTHFPAWSIFLSLQETVCLHCEDFADDYPRIMINRSKDDWIHGWITYEDDDGDGGFHIEGGIGNLDEMLGIVRSFVETMDAKRKKYILEQASKIEEEL